MSLPLSLKDRYAFYYSIGDSSIFFSCFETTFLQSLLSDCRETISRRSSIWLKSNWQRELQSAWKESTEHLTSKEFYWTCLFEEKLFYLKREAIFAHQTLWCTMIYTKKQFYHITIDWFEFAECFCMINQNDTFFNFSIFIFSLKNNLQNRLCWRLSIWRLFLFRNSARQNAWRWSSYSVAISPSLHWRSAFLQLHWSEFIYRLKFLWSLQKVFKLRKTLDIEKLQQKS